VLVNQVNQEGLFNDFQEVFKESGRSVSGTREVQEGGFIENGIDYSVIDTVGLGDTKLPKEIVLDKIADAVYLAKEGVSQVFFVIDEKFNPHEMANYDLLKNIIFDEQVVDYTTIVRTRFEDFKDQEKCLTDIEAMIKEEGKLAEIINSCQARVIYVNNPSLNLVPAKNESEDRKKIREDKIIQRKLTRNDSRKILLNSLKNFTKRGFYQPAKLKNLSAELATTIKEKKDLEQKLKELQEKHSPISSPTLETNQITTVIAPVVITESEEITDNSNSQSSKIIGIGDSKHSREKTQQLESERKRLEKAIAEKQNQIRAKVFKHILNNAEELTKELGGNIFLTSVIDDGQDWTRLHLDFTLANKIKWLQRDFNYDQIKNWSQALKDSFNPDDDVDFCAWLKNDKKLTPSALPTHNLKSLRNEYHSWLDVYTQGLNKINQQTNVAEDWKEIHEDFDEYYQQNWEEKGFDYNQTKEWIKVGLEVDEYEFATYLRVKNYQSNSDLNLEQLRGEFNTWKANPPVQEYLDIFYPKEKRSEITELSIDYRNLQGNLDLSGFVNLKTLSCRNNKLPSLDFLATLKNPEKLTRLDIYGNSSTGKLTLLRKLINLEFLDLENNLLSDSLEPLRNMSKLRSLDISNNDINSGLEYLPESIENFACLADERKDAKVKAIYDCFADEKEKLETGWGGSIINFPQKLQVYKQKLVREKVIEIWLPLKDIPSKYWDKVEVGNDWDREYRVSREKETPLLINYDSYLPHKKFKNQKLLERFKKYSSSPNSVKFFDLANTWPNNQAPFIKDIKIEDIFDSNSSVVGGILRDKKFTDFLDKNKLFKSGESGELKDQEAFEFLQSIIESQEIKATVKLTQEELEQFRQENQELQSQIQISSK